MRAGAVADGLRLSFGTLTALPVPAPGTVDRSAAAVAMTAAVLPGAVLGAAAGAVGAALLVLGTAPAVVGAAVVGTGVLLTRFLHVDGLADTADGLVAGRTAQRALEVMHRGDTGPAGATSLVLVLGGQAAAVAALADGRPWWVLLGLVTLAWAASRSALPLLTAQGVRAAQASGLGARVVGSVPAAAAGLPVATLVVLGLLAGGVPAALAPVAAALAATGLAVHAHRRLGGLTGDVLGAAVEVSLLAALVVLGVG